MAANVPQVRFAGFTGPWEQRKFSDIASRSGEMSNAPELPQVEYEDVVSGLGSLNKDLFSKCGGKTGLLFDPDDILYGKLRPYLKNWFLPGFSGIAVGDWWVLRPIDVDPPFLYSLIQSDHFQDVANVSAGSKMPRADWTLVSEAKFGMPAATDEQKRIGTYFAQLDNLITLHQREASSLKQGWIETS